MDSVVEYVREATYADLQPGESFYYNAGRTLSHLDGLVTVVFNTTDPLPSSPEDRKWVFSTSATLEVKHEKRGRMGLSFPRNGEVSVLRIVKSSLSSFQEEAASGQQFTDTFVNDMYEDMLKRKKTKRVRLGGG